MRKCLFLLLGLLLAVAVSSAQSEERPLIAIIKFGDLPPFNRAEQGILDMLDRYGYEDGENIDLFFANAELSIDQVPIIMEQVFTMNPTIVMPISTPMARAAAEVAATLENPPVVIFNTVTNPYATGIAESPCLKPAYLTGSQSLPPYSQIVAQIRAFDSSIEVLGYMYNPAEANSVYSTPIITTLAEEQGLQIIAYPVNDTAHAEATAELLMGEGIDAFFIPNDTTATSALPHIIEVSIAGSIPVFVADVNQVYVGATLGAGYNAYQEGVDAGRLAIYTLRGELDVARTAIGFQSSFILAMNLDSLNAQGLEASEELLNRLDFVIENGESSEIEPALPDMSLQDMEAADRAFLENLHCTEERIAEEAAALERSE